MLRNEFYERVCEEMNNQGWEERQSPSGLYVTVTTVSSNNIYQIVSGDRALLRIVSYDGLVYTFLCGRQFTVSLASKEEKNGFFLF